MLVIDNNFSDRKTEESKSGTTFSLRLRFRALLRPGFTTLIAVAAMTAAAVAAAAAGMPRKVAAVSRPADVLGLSGSGVVDGDVTLPARDRGARVAIAKPLMLTATSSTAAAAPAAALVAAAATAASAAGSAITFVAVGRWLAGGGTEYAAFAASAAKVGLFLDPGGPPLFRFPPSPACCWVVLITLSVVVRRSALAVGALP